MAGIFISYRRSDSGDWATKIFNHIGIRFGRDIVFKDVESITPADKWAKVIKKKIAECEIFLAVIGPKWLQLRDAEGNRRIDDKEDILRQEITEAFDKNRTVLPVLVGGAQMPLESDLPGSINKLAGCQAAELNDERWNRDMEKLLDHLRDLITPTREMISLSAVQQETYQMQLRYFDLLEKEKDFAGALELAQKTSKLLDRTFPLYPQDSYLKVSRGYSLKNEAMALLRLERATEGEQALYEADLVFHTMRAENQRDAGAWNGSGSVEAVRGNYRKALEYINKALEIDPNYEEAIRDREMVLQKIQLQNPSNSQ